ncbi:MAG: PA14 domain-containing protein [Roseateles sp.]|nr:hypothetical protein [Methylibium sp.]MBY0367917.1 hypothetical protein [Burkholderiaceae bacterium]
MSRSSRPIRMHGPAGAAARPARCAPWVRWPTCMAWLASRIASRLGSRLAAWLLVGLAALLAPLSQAQEAPGVRAEYFNYPSSTRTPSFPTGAATVDRIEDNINVYLITNSPAPGIGADYYLVRYTGHLLIPTTGAYSFRLEGDDGIRLYVDCNGSDGDQTLPFYELLATACNLPSSGACPNGATTEPNYAERQLSRTLKK